MKYKKLILLLSLFIITFIYIVNPYIVESRPLDEKPFKEDKDGIIRFHVRANSDLREDQELKLKIRDKVLEKMNQKFDKDTTIEESREIIKKSLDEIKDISKTVLNNEGKDYEVHVNLGSEIFPIRKYGNMVFPQGEYETLLIEIGEAQGKNWWCVMFPPLCFVDITHSVAVETTELEEFVVEEDEPIKVKSKIVELVDKIKDKF